MGKRTEYEPGTFSYVELSTGDPGAAKAFYGELLGWDFEDTQLPEEAGGGTYTTCKVQGDTAAAIFQGDGSLPPHWNNYVTVASADDAAAKAKELGGQVMMEPFDVMTFGRMAAIADPTGAAFNAWEPRDSVGAERVNDPGCLTWNELQTTDVDAAVGFYEGLFGWGTEEMDTQGGPRYVIAKVGERSNGGVMEAQGGMPSAWIPYFTVESRDAAADKGVERGATEFVRLELPAGNIAMLADPQGAAFALFEGEVDD
ncbi:MAG TPA: VOC family protein [Solirubrobacterales bacterium]